MIENKEVSADEINPIENSTVVKDIIQSFPIPTSSSFITAWDLLQAPNIEQRFLVENIIPAGVICLIAGPSDTGKSILARQIAMSAALGKSDVAGFPLNLRYKKAIYVSTEDGEGTWQNKLKMFGLPDNELPSTSNLKLMFDYENFNASILEQELKNDPVDVVVIDVFTDIYSKDLNNAIHVRSFFSEYKFLANKYGCTFIFVHHLNKKGESGAPSKLNVSGSQGIESAMRCVIELRADNMDDEMRHLVVTKCNILPPQEKKFSYKLSLSPRLEFTYTGDRYPIGTLSSSRPGTSLTTKLRVVELSKEGFSTRGISQELEKEGITLKKTAVNDLLRKASFNNTEDEEIGYENSL